MNSSLTLVSVNILLWASQKATNPLLPLGVVGLSFFHNPSLMGSDSSRIILALQGDRTPLNRARSGSQGFLGGRGSSLAGTLAGRFLRRHDSCR
jgi:hypothetical protein